MTELGEALEKVTQRIDRYKGQDVNEQNTKTALVNPVLQALGWDVGDLEEVQQEYKRRPRDKPVDYALLVMRTPRLFVEAKALGQNLEDRRWANQIMGYATVAGVKWVVITNGDEYRVYNACAEVPVEEKLFRKVCVTDQNASAEETLILLSKERIKEIDDLWNAHFVDRQVRAALEEIFTADPDASVVRLLRKRVRELSPNEITASLQRLQVRFDFPVDPGTVTASAAPGKRRRRKSGPSRKTLGVSLRDVIQAGLLVPPLKLFRHYKGHDLEAELNPDGTVSFQGTSYKTCSHAADLARSTVTGRRMNTNGWTFWQYRDQNGKLLELAVPRQELLKRKSTEAS